MNKPPKLNCSLIWNKALIGFGLNCTRGHVDALEVFAEPVADRARDGQVQPGDHFDLLDGLAVPVGALLLKGNPHIQIRGLKHLTLSLTFYKCIENSALIKNM